MKKERIGMLCGIIANIIFMIGDWLMDAFGTESTEIGLIAETGFSNIAMWRLTATIIAGAVGIAFYVPAANAFMRLSEKTCRKDRRVSCFMSKVFHIGLYAGMVSSFCIHTLCGMVGVIWKSSLAQGVSEETAAAITNTAGTTFIVPFFVYYLLIEFAVSIPFIYMVLSGELKLKKPAALCCSLVTLIVPAFFKLFGNQFLNDLLTARESLGWVLMFLMGFIAVKRVYGNETGNDGRSADERATAERAEVEVATAERAAAGGETATERAAVEGEMAGGSEAEREAVEVATAERAAAGGETATERAAVEGEMAGGSEADREAVEG